MRRASLSLETGRGTAAGAAWIVRGDDGAGETRHTSSHGAGAFANTAEKVRQRARPETGRGDAAAATRIVRGDGSRRRRGRDADIPPRRRGRGVFGADSPRRRVPAATRIRRGDEETPQAWKDGLGALYEDADRFLLKGDEAGARRAFGRAKASLLAAALAGDAAAGTALSLATLAGVAPSNATAPTRLEVSAPLRDDSAAAARAIADVRRRAQQGCWLARLAMGSWRAEGRRGFSRDCAAAADHWTRLLQDVAAPGSGSPDGARVRVRHAGLAPNELLVDHWLRADGFWTLREDAAAALRDEDADAEDDALDAERRDEAVPRYRDPRADVEISRSRI